MPAVSEVIYRGCLWRLWHDHPGLRSVTITVRTVSSYRGQPNVPVVMLAYQYTSDEEFFDDLEDEDDLVDFATEHAEDVFAFPLAGNGPLYKKYLSVDDTPWEIHNISDSEARLEALRAYRRAMGINHE